MTPADVERRLHELEQRVLELERGQAILSTGVALARWAVPVLVSIAAILIIFVK